MGNRFVFVLFVNRRTFVMFRLIRLRSQSKEEGGWLRACRLPLPSFLLKLLSIHPVQRVNIVQLQTISAWSRAATEHVVDQVDYIVDVDRRIAATAVGIARL